MLKCSCQTPKGVFILSDRLLILLIFFGLQGCYIINLAHAQCIHLSTFFSATELVVIESRRIIKNKCFDLMRIFSW